MKNTLIFPLLFCLVVLINPKISAQLVDEISPNLLVNPWEAKWITHPDILGNEYGVYLFRKSFELDEVSSEFIVHISADNRYKLYVNGTYVVNGPAVGDLMHWNFESLNLAPYLKEGKNVIAATVWNFAEQRPMANISHSTGLIVQGNSDKESIVNSTKDWKVKKDTSYSPIPYVGSGYYVVGPGEEFKSINHPWGWEHLTFNTTDWKNAKELDNGRPLKSTKQYGGVPRYILQPRKIPLMEETPQQFASVRRSNLSGIHDGFITGKKTLQIPANSKIKILVDHGTLTNAYPTFNYSKGQNSTIQFTFAESLYDAHSEKKNRNEVKNKQIAGTKNILISGGGDNRTYTTLWWRTFRYVELEIETKEEPLLIHNFNSTFTGYPFKEQATFTSDYSILEDIWETGWRTQRLCSGETFFDCPYYEQLQYVGDTRIQCLVSSYVTGDNTMFKNAIASIGNSRMPIGLTQSRFPSREVQIIPTFSLVWITMLHDYWMLDGNETFINSHIPGVLDVLKWYEDRMDETQMLGHMEWWNFVDWVPDDNWTSGVPSGAQFGNSTIISLQYVYTLQKASELLTAFGFIEKAREYNSLAEKIKTSVYKNCFVPEEGILADTPKKNNFSQHANALGILTNIFPRDENKNVLNKILRNPGIAKCTYYYSFYLTEAMEKAGMASDYIASLKPWENMLDLGLTTFAEKPDPTRSDCHAWSASPVYYFLSLVCGIKPAEAGFKSVTITPNLGDLEWVEGSVPHQLGTISVSLKKKGSDGLAGEILIPQELTGTFVWKGNKITLQGGSNTINLK
ncbi:hypothetical protein GGR42_002894 [Saonia flava]|uniref:Alpha-L-rhamnosidase n=1 Tax=Saonia flava TaxID=523696 RepID=A0A846R1U9_9FLAO|nr:alpha-L-rhamnosidase C-terminal domain-containing protein [Saonia flava]NJB72403.1 hypothetical protein [Saonia flava]